MPDSTEEFNKHQQDLTNRASSFVQMLFVLAGSALSVSIALFTGPNKIKLDPELQCALTASWWLLVSSVVLLCAFLTTIILRDYFFGERWRKHHNDPSFDPDDRPGLPDKLMIAFGLLGVATFTAGFIGLSFVATSLLRIA